MLIAVRIVCLLSIMAQLVYVGMSVALALSTHNWLYLITAPINTAAALVIGFVWFLAETRYDEL